jgi:hypothetical protein
VHHQAWRCSELNQREYCEAQGIPLKAFGNWRAKFKAEPQLPERKLLYRRGGLSHTLSHSLSHTLSHVTYPSWLKGPVVPPARDGHRRRFSEADKRRILEDGGGAKREPRQDRAPLWHRSARSMPMEARLSSSIMGRRNSPPPPPKPRGGVAALAGGEEQASQGQVSLSTCTPPFQGEVEYRCCRLGTLIATQTKAPLLLGPGPGQPASQRRGGEARRRRPVQEARDDSW